MKLSFVLVFLCATTRSGAALSIFFSAAPRSAPSRRNVSAGRYLNGATKLSSSAEDGSEDDPSAVPDSDVPMPPPPLPEKYGSSDLKTLLPTLKRRTLRLDKFGRRIHDLTDDGTSKYSKKPVAVAVGGMASAADVATSLLMSEIGKGGSESPKLSKILNTENGRPTTTKSAKELAADASSADFGREVKYSSDLKALLPKQKMRFMKLDKFGRRIQRMEDDGTVNMKKEPKQQQSTLSITSSSGTSVDSIGSQKEVDVAARFEVGENMPLTKLMGMAKEEQGGGDSATLGGGEQDVDLKELLPKQKMRFSKLDKFGRRVQRMEDDGTVNLGKDPGKTTPKIQSHRGTKDGFNSDSASVVDLESSQMTISSTSNYASLKDLLPKKPIWTKLDFHGAPVEDKRRTKRVDNTSSNSVDNLSGLKELLPKRPVWTRLDFHGVPVEDERRTKSIANTSSGSFGKGDYSNLNNLLPERKIKWRKQGELLSSGSATALSENVRGLREERQHAIKAEVIASVNESNADEEEDNKTSGVSSSSNGSFNQGSYLNLTTLLPERKIKWKKHGELLSSGSATTENENVRGLREERQHAMGDDLIVSAKESSGGEEDNSETSDASV